MENGFIYDAMQGAFIQTIGEFTLVQRNSEKQIAVFKGGKCVDTFNTREAAKGYALRGGVNLLNPETVFAAFWATALEDAQLSENDIACTEGREPHDFSGEPNADYLARYHGACEAVCAAAEPILATLDLNQFPRGQGESSLSEVFGSDLYLTAAGHGVRRFGRTYQRRLFLSLNNQPKEDKSTCPQLLDQ
ncbi:hypothetical protein [Rhizobium nepotum]|uniref:hypothetical protein n=1 Tax=Rhizobium nepotum TaxID=1035271 RepID=UPI003CFB44E7